MTINEKNVKIFWEKVGFITTLADTERQTYKARS